MVNTYAMSYACLECCKPFKRQLSKPVRDPEEMVCPDCGGPAYNFGRHFKPPKKSNKKQWKKIRFLFEHGFRFQKIHVNKNRVESIPYPETLEEAKDFVIKYKEFSWS
jgi:DNA-directed RNA polymerase subunit RPC12/RpoP